MDRAALLELLAEADRHLAETEQHTSHQREIIADLEHMGRGGSETAQTARELLNSMERARRARMAYRDGLQLMLSTTA
jgi:hypothetical protein